MNAYGPLFDYNLSTVPVLAKPRTPAPLPGGLSRESTTPTRAVMGAAEESRGGAQNLSGEQLRDQGIQQVSEHNENWMENALTASKRFVFYQGLTGTFTGEDIRFACQWLPQPKSSNAWGALINTLIKRKIIVPTGEHRHMKDSRSHARSTPVYKAP